jgi:hypothetical protein
VVEADHAALVQAFRGARDLAGLVADALEVGDHLDRRHHGAQVVRGRLAAHDQVAAGVVELDFELVHGLVVGHHLVGLLGIADAEASSASSNWVSTMPPISSTLERIASSSWSYCLDE